MGVHYQISFDTGTSSSQASNHSAFSCRLHICLYRQLGVRILDDLARRLDGCQLHHGDHHDAIVQVTQSVHDLSLGLPFETPQKDIDTVRVHDLTEHAYHDVGLRLPLVLESLQQQIDSRW